MLGGFHETLLHRSSSLIYYILLLPYNIGLFIGEYAVVVEARYISTQVI